MKHRHFYRLLMLLIALPMIGCAGNAIKDYPDTLKKNLTIRTNLKPGGLFGSMRASVHIFQIDRRCKTTLEGKVDLKKNQTKLIGLPVSKPVYLVFKFIPTSWGESRAEINHDVYMKLKKGRHYDAELIYKNDLYSVKIKEVHTGRARSRTLDIGGIEDCKPRGR